MPPESRKSRERISLPPRVFLYTLDQVAAILAVQDVSRYIWTLEQGGIRAKDKLTARNIAPVGATPEWRVADNELIRWLRYKGFRYVEVGYVES